MAASTGFAAGVESNDVLLSYGVEAVWGTAPATQFQALRLTSESLSGTKERQRPSEINPLHEMVQSVTSRETAGGAINYALSYGTFDEMFSIVLGNDWQALQAINGVAADITITNLSATSATLSSATAGKFTNVSAGQYIRLLGFANAANNGFHYISAKASALSITLSTPAVSVTETPTGTNAKVRASTLINGSQFKSLSMQKGMSATQFFRYPGMFVPSFTMTGSVGGFISGAFQTVAQSESKSTSNQSTGAVLAAPTGTVHDSIGAFGGEFWNETAVTAALQSFNIQVSRDGAGAEYGMGLASAAGMRRGTFTATGDMTLFFRDFTQYDIFKAETTGRLAFITKDAAGQAYVLSFKNAALMNPSIVAGGPGQTVTAKFTIEGNPQSGGGTFQMDRLAAA